MSLHSLKGDMSVIIVRSSTKRFYIASGQVLDLYKDGANFRYGCGVNCTGFILSIITCLLTFTTA